MSKERGAETRKKMKEASFFNRNYKSHNGRISKYNKICIYSILAGISIVLLDKGNACIINYFACIIKYG